MVWSELMAIFSSNGCIRKGQSSAKFPLHKERNGDWEKPESVQTNRVAGEGKSYWKIKIYLL